VPDRLGTTERHQCASWRIDGGRIKRARAEHDPPLTQHEHAKRAGVGQPYIAMIERGTRTPPLRTLAAVCAPLGLSPADVIVSDDDATKGAAA
jgi:predicted transcriptional regulator